MKSLVLCFTLLTLFGASQGYAVQRRIPIVDAETINQILNLTKSLQDPYAYTATVNALSDEILANLDKTLKKNKLDPFLLDDIYKGYWWGNLKLKKIQISGLTTLRRPNEDAVLTYVHSNKQLQFDLPISFKDLEFSCHFKASVMFVGPSGRITGEVKNLLMRTSLVIDYNENQAFLRTFEIADSGHIKLHIHSSIFSDWIYNLISDALTAIFKSSILGTVSAVVQDLLGNIIDVVDQILKIVLG